jgi:hypothetical protein
MSSEELHISDEELLQAADGELGTRRAAQVQVHLAACWNCRARMAEIESAIGDFVRAHRETHDSQLPPADGPRALLRAQLAELASKPKVHSWRLVRQSNSTTRAAAILVAFVTAVLVGRLVFQHLTPRGPGLSAAGFERGALPNRSLTPGATRNLAISDICSMAHEEVVRDVSASIRQEVFQEYGIVNARAEDYEIDYLIPPGLGGVEDPHNLWPEPHTSQMWNSYVKDALEERLHQSVCAGELDLGTAQHDIASDWIAAYKKYFHTDAPLPSHSRFGTSAPVFRKN